MPERDKQTDHMSRTLAGAGSRPPLDRLGTKPAEVTDEQWDDAQTLADRVYVDLIQGIDFQRVLIEAQKRHAIIHPAKTTYMAAADIGFGNIDSLCHECLTEVLLATDTNPPWSEEAESPRYLRYDPTEGITLTAPDDPYAALGLIAPEGEDDEDDLPGVGYWRGVSTEPDHEPDWTPPDVDGPADEIADADTESWLREHGDG